MVFDQTARTTEWLRGIASPATWSRRIGIERGGRNRSWVTPPSVALLRTALFLGASALFVAVQPAMAQVPASKASAVSNPKAQNCLSELRTFDTQMQKDGYWVGGSSYRYGYPLYGYGYGYGYGHGEYGWSGNPSTSGHWLARPGYELRTLIASANVLGQRGQEQTCTALLTSIRDLYKSYAHELQQGGVPRVDGHNWRSTQIAAATPVAESSTSYRSDQLIGANLFNSQGEDLGSVDDIVLSPQTGKVGYLVIGRGGILGIGEKYVPVPWEHFKATAGSNFLVLDSTKGNMEAAPRVIMSSFFRQGDFDQQRQKVDDYWKAHVSK
jgi:sporulation protein YlmC with PRC-barrel domain